MSDARIIVYVLIYELMITAEANEMSNSDARQLRGLK